MARSGVGGVESAVVIHLSQVYSSQAHARQQVYSITSCIRAEYNWAVGFITNPTGAPMICAAAYAGRIEPLTLRTDPPRSGSSAAVWRPPRPRSTSRAGG